MTPEPSNAPYRILFSIALLLFLYVSMSQFRNYERLYSSSQHDLRAYLACAHNLLADRHIYETHHQRIPEDPTLTDDVPRYLYPPLLGMLMIPTTPLSYDTFKHIWFFLNFFFIVHSVFLVTAVLPLGSMRFSVFFAVTAVMAGSDAFSWLLRTAQVDGFVVWLSVLSLWCFVRSRWISAALLIAVASWIKVTPGIFFLFFLTRGNLRFALYAVASGVFLGLLQWVVAGEQFVYFFTNTMSDMPRPMRAPSMQSLWSLVQVLTVPFRTAEVWNRPDWSEPMLQWLKVAVTFPVVTLMFFGRQDREGVYMGFAVCAAFSLLITDVSWMMRFVWNLVTVAGLLFGVLMVKNRIVATGLSIFGALLILLNIRSVFQSMFGDFEGWRVVFVAGPSIHALLSLFILFVFAMRMGGWCGHGVLLYRWVQRGMTGLRSRRIPATASNAPE